MSERVECRPIRAGDVDRITTLMDTVAVRVAGYSGRALYRVIGHEALRDRGVRLIMAESGGVPTGFVLAVIDPRSSYRSLLLRHPAIALRILGRRLRDAVRARRRAAPAAAGSGPDPAPAATPGRAATSWWNQSGPQIARIVMIGVSPACRRRGIGEALYRALFQDLAAHGVRTVRARIDHANRSSIRLHQQTGWQFQDIGPALEATRDLA